MPFDGPIPTTDKPSLAALSYVLRHREMWPEGFVWDYGSCTRCAMGLSTVLWRTMGTPCTEIMVRSFKMNRDDAQHIFLFLHKNDVSEITPQHVADAIDRLLAETE